MRKNPRISLGVVCALVAFGLAAKAGLGGVAFAATAEGMVSTVKSFIQAEDFESAETAALELTEYRPEYLQGWVLLGYCQSRNEQYVESNVSYEKALKLGAEPESIGSRMAYNYIRLREFSKARDCYRTILETEREHVESLKQLGYLEGKLGNYDLAAHYYRRILERDPEDAKVIRALARIEVKRGGGGVVRELLLKNLELNADDTESLGTLGRIYIKEKNFKAAVVPLEKLVALEPDNVVARRNLGVAYYQLGDKRRACAEFQRVKDLGGDMSGLYGPLADCYYKIGERADAMVVIKEGLDNDTQVAWFYCMWGKILEDRRSYDAAIGKFAKAAGMKVEPWSTYARKQITRQEKLKKRAQMISSQQGMN